MKNKYYTSRDPIKNYFPLPNEVFALRLSPGALAVYSYLMYIEASRIPPLRSRKHEQLFTNALTHSISCDTIITRIIFRVFIVIIASTVFRVNRFL